MTDARTFYLVRPDVRQRALDHVRGVPDGYVVTVREPEKKRAQEDRYHAMIGDIAKQTEYAGRRWDRENTKRILLDEFQDAMRANGEPLRQESWLIPSEDGRRVIHLGIQSRRLSVKEASNFIEFLFAWGSERGVKWGEKARES